MAIGNSSIATLIEKAKNTISTLADEKYYDNIFRKNDFALINSYLALTAFEQERNIYIRTCNYESALQLAIPILYPIAIKILLENANLYNPYFEEVAENNYFVNNTGIYINTTDNNSNIKDKFVLKRFIKDGFRYKYPKNTQDIFNFYFLVPKIYEPQRNIIKKLEHYRSFFSSIHKKASENNIFPPSLFKKKIMLVCQKSYIKDQLKNTFLNCIPLAFIINNNNEEFSIESNMLIDPMILITYQYEIAFEYIKRHNNETQFSYLLIIDANKENNVSFRIKNFCANEYIKNFGFIGNEPVKNDNSMLLWNWENKEEMKLKGKFEINYDFSHSLEESSEITQAVNKYYEILVKINNEFEEIKFYYPAINSLQRIIKDKLYQITEFDSKIAEHMFTRMQESFLSHFYEIEDFEEYYNELKQILYKIYNLLRSSPGIKERLQTMNKEKIYLVVENTEYDNWEQNLENYDNVYLFSYKDFLKDITSHNSKSTYWLTFIPDEKKLIQLYNTLLEQEVNVRLLLYPSEIRIFKARQKNIREKIRNNYGIKDLSLFPELEIEVQEKELLDDLINRFEEEFDDYTDIYDYNSNRYLFYKISVLDREENKNIITIPHKILKETNSEIDLVTINDLISGDNILVYDNKKRESFYEILSEESEKIKDVNYYSILWKERLKKYLNYEVIDYSKSENYYSVDKMGKLCNYLGIKPDYIIRNWFNNPDRVRFPKKSILEKLVTILKNNYLLNSEEEREIKSARKFFVGIMISLGQNLSSELQTIMLINENSRDNFIKENVIDNKNQFPFLCRFDLESIKSIIKHNFTKYKFIEIIEKEEVEDND